ncbi:putative histone deacetylase complex subunit SAP30/SAP30 [Helianthus anomalus]
MLLNLFYIRYLIYLYNSIMHCIWTHVTCFQRLMMLKTWFVTMFSASDDAKKVHRSRHRPCKSTTGSPLNKTVGRSLHHDSQSKASFTTSRGSLKIDLRKLEMVALRRYLLHFNLKRLMFSCTCHKREESIIREKVDFWLKMAKSAHQVTVYDYNPKDDKDKRFCV